MKEAILKSIEGGWEPVDFTNMLIETRGVLFHDDFPADTKEEPDPAYVYFYDTEYPDQGWYASMHMELALLDPNFWKALIPKERTVTLDLKKMESSVMGRPWHREAQKVSYVKKSPNRWRTEWHRFINHIADGGTPDEFFNNLISPTKGKE